MPVLQVNNVVPAVPVLGVMSGIVVFTGEPSITTILESDGSEDPPLFIAVTST